MAHADYNCCAICDCKLDYCGCDEAETKQEICEDCLKNLNDYGYGNVNTVDDFINLIDCCYGERYDKVKELLVKCNYHFCYYDNDVDKAVLYRFSSAKGEYFKDVLNTVNKIEQGGDK